MKLCNFRENMRHITFHLFLMITMLIFSFLSGITQLDTTVAAADEIPLISFKDGVDEQIADVTPGNNNSVTFQCIADGNYFKNMISTGIICNLYTTLEIESINDEFKDTRQWTADINPEVIELNGTRSVNFSVTVNVPEGLSYHMLGNVDLFGTAITLPDNKEYQIQTITGIVRISQFYDFEVSAKDTFESIEKGEKASFYIEIINEGNGVDTVDLYVQNIEELYDAGITIEISLYNIEIKMNSTKVITLIAKTSSDTKPGDYIIEFEAGPDYSFIINENDSPVKNIDLHLTVEPDFWDVYFYPSIIILVILNIILWFKLIMTRRKKSKK